MSRTKAKHRGRNNIDRTVTHLGFDTYEAYLRSDGWKSFVEAYRTLGLPQRCIACGLPKFELHHTNYKHMGVETMADVIPVCVRCHRLLHKAHRQAAIPLARPDLAFQRVFGWSDQETVARFQPFIPLWRGRAAPAPTARVTPRAAPKPRPDPFYKLNRDARNVRAYLANGYTHRQVALMYKVSPALVAKFIQAEVAP